MARIGVITFPGTLDDVDALRAVRLSGAEPVSLWHKDADLHAVDAVVVPRRLLIRRLPTLRRHRPLAPVMQEVIDAANKGMPVLGICNGFQILTEPTCYPAP